MEPPWTAIVEAREESMISPTGGDSNPTTRTGHFLKPSISAYKPPPTTFQSPSSHLSSPKPSKIDVSFHGWRSGGEKWKLWAEKMASIHKLKWEKAGILDAVMNSVYQIRRDDDLVYRLAEKWCCRTNSFIFRWGEATLTLEDMANLGFSVSGFPVFLPVAAAEETEELWEIKQRLEAAVTELKRSKARKASVQCWNMKFRDSENSIEHEAFLVAWLSYYVFPNTRDSIRREAIPIAIHIASGTRIALAPAVLSTIYRDLTILKREIVQSSNCSSSSSSNSNDSSSTAILWSPFQLVQVWAWERFPRLQPRPEQLAPGTPRLARWRMAKKDDSIEDASLVLESDADSFVWRPYALPLRNWDFLKFYGDKEKWVTLKPGCDDDDGDDFIDFARCLRVSYLVGLDNTVERYFPNRVAMQFGLDQDIPGCVEVDSNSNEKCRIDAWGDYSKDLEGVRLYVPSRLFEADVTTQYKKWWKREFVELQRPELRSLGDQKKPKGKKKRNVTSHNKKGKRMKDSNGGLSDAGGRPATRLEEASAYDSEDDLTISELLKLKAAEKINGGEDGKTCIQSSNGEVEAADESPAERRGDDYDSGHKHLAARNVAEKCVLSGKGSDGGGDGYGGFLSGESQCHSFSGMESVSLVNPVPDRAARTPVIKLEAVTEKETRGSINTASVTQGIMSRKVRIDQTTTRLEDLLSYMEKKIGLQ